MHTVTRVVRTALVLLGIVLLATPAYAQFDRSQLSGRVRDSSGGLVPGATVTATNTQTQINWTAVTDLTGFYTFPNLPPGKYTTSRPSCRDSRKPSARTSRSTPPASVDARLHARTGRGDRVGHRHRGNAGPADRHGAAQDDRVARHRTAVVLRPQPDRRRRPQGRRRRRQLQQLQLLGPRQRRLQHQRQPHRREQHHRRRRDRDPHPLAGAIVGIQNVDALQEVQVLTGDYMPEYGRASGGQIRMVTKSGGNRFHGSGSFFMRDDKLQANTWTRNKSPNALENSGPAPFDYKQYGYSIGGPIDEGQAVLLRARRNGSTTWPRETERCDGADRS